VLVGTTMDGLTVFSNGVQALIEKGHRKITPFFIPYAITNMGSALLAIELSFIGPNYSISTAYATSNYCFYDAANHISLDSEIVPTKTTCHCFLNSTCN
jgi:3-oxoacyl-[acyl-carrier-protein] synthase II